jgi:hypothetical protein
MNIAEAQVLLGMAAMFDNRKPDEDAAKAWAAALDDLRFIDCRDALIEHYKTSTEWLMPAMVRATVKRIRAKRIADFGHFDVPHGLKDADYNRFLLDTRRRIADGEITSAKELETPDLKPRVLPDLRRVLAADIVDPADLPPVERSWMRRQREELA